MRRREDPLVMASGRYTLTRKQAAERRGISVSSIRRLEFVKLNPVNDGSGIWRFDPAEVDALVLPSKRLARRVQPRLSQRREGRIAARVFALLESGADLTHIVVSLQLPPSAVRKLHREWLAGLDDALPKKGEEA